MDTPLSIDMGHAITGVDRGVGIDPSLEAISTTAQNFDYFSHGLCHLWLETPFDGIVPGLLRQDETNSSKSPSTYSFTSTHIELPCLTPNNSNGYKLGPNISSDPFNHYSTSTASTASTDFSPIFMCLDSLSTDSSPSSFYDVSCADFKFSPPSMFLDAFSTDLSSGSILDTSLTEFDFSCNPIHPPSSPVLVETHQSPRLGSISDSPPRSAPLVPRKPPSRPCDIRKQKRKIEKPETCPICSKGHAERRELNRHIKSRHKGLAKAMELPMEKIKCKHLSCPGTFERKDHLTRHMKRTHGAK
ncbi:hypothetical protein B0J13DRAFT_4546 [Dactylonectria estremocensis]|uniref:C2H2-type domain-containing protein n=1 Tax=Dactylonectria estremocensis TaxID=1079267 RepID=A0A9P9FIF2_9HYPO|nr:hypothetical protein B0J13DRAFT_4546 [Dactylonectria estremocensis]